MKVTATRGRIGVCVLAVFGMIVLTCGTLFLGLFEQIVRFFLKRDLVLTPGSEFYDIWKELPIPIYQKIYVFNITNPEEFSHHGAKPIVQELGPYVYRGVWRKEGMEWDAEEGTVTYKDFKEYTFDPSLSTGDQEELIYTLNGPLLAVINYVEEYAPSLFRSFISEIMNGIFESYNETLLVHKSIRELVYEGYQEPMVADLIQVVEPFIDLPLKLINNTFGILHEKKHVGDGVFTIKSGANGIDDYASIQRWNNKSSVDWWNGEHCNQINGTDGVQYAPGVTRNHTLNLFNPNLCRSLPLQYERDITVHGIKTLRFGLKSDVLSSGDVNPDNKCYCVGDNCHISGILSLSTCKKGAPYVISLPHFLEGEASLQESLEGVHPVPEKHKSYIDVEPNTGFVLNAAFRIQLNGVTKKLPSYKPLRHVGESIVPVLWMSEEAQLNTYFANYFKSRVQTPLVVFKALSIACVVLGILWTMSAMLFVFCIAAKVKPVPLKHSVVMKTLNSVYTSVALWPPTEEEIKEANINEKTYL